MNIRTSRVLGFLGATGTMGFVMRFLVSVFDLLRALRLGFGTRCLAHTRRWLSLISGDGQYRRGHPEKDHCHECHCQCAKHTHANPPMASSLGDTNGAMLAARPQTADTYNNL